MAILDIHINEFLKRYHNFRLIDLKNDSLNVLRGVITVVDENRQIWADYDVRIEISSAYPHTIPSVYEVSNLIERDWNFHISKDGKCCLDISHALILKKKSGVNLIHFYQNVIYPFFANHQFKLADGNYANGEYEHFEKGIIQFYNEKLGLIDRDYILALLKVAILETKYSRNSLCVICGSSKFKRCCQPRIKQLKLFGKNQLKIDYEIFKSQSYPTP